MPFEPFENSVRGLDSFLNESRVLQFPLGAIALDDLQFVAIDEKARPGVPCGSRPSPMGSWLNGMGIHGLLTLSPTPRSFVSVISIGQLMVSSKPASTSGPMGATLTMPACETVVTMPSRITIVPTGRRPPGAAPTAPRTLARVAYDRFASRGSLSCGRPGAPCDKRSSSAGTGR